MNGTKVPGCDFENPAKNFENPAKCLIIKIKSKGWQDIPCFWQDNPCAPPAPLYRSFAATLSGSLITLDLSLK